MAGIPLGKHRMFLSIVKLSHRNLDGSPSWIELHLFISILSAFNFIQIIFMLELDLGNTVEPLIDAVDQACQQDRQEVEAHVRLPFHP